MLIFNVQSKPMTKEQIIRAIESLDKVKLGEVVLFSRKGHSKEDAITDMIAAKLREQDPSMLLDLRKGLKDSLKKPDLVHKKSNETPDALEAKHYSSGQDQSFYSHVEGPIHDSYKLVGLGFNNHYILQYTSELVGLSDEIAKIPKSELSDNVGMLRYYFNDKGLMPIHASLQPNSDYSTKLAKVFSGVFGQEAKPITLPVSKEIPGKGKVHFNVHFSLMHVTCFESNKERYCKVLMSRSVSEYL